MGMYSDIVEGVSENIKIMDIPFYAENISSDEPYNRRELNRTSILNGTEHVSPGKYVPRSYSFSTVIYHPINRPDAYDNIFREMLSKPVKVVSRYMGGSFMAEIKIEKNIEECSPNHLALDISVTEIPGKKSLIPGEPRLIVPAVKKIDLKEKHRNQSNNKYNKALKNCKVPFKKNAKNDCVKNLQNKLILLGYLNKKYSTGKYDSNTVKAVKKFQTKYKQKYSLTATGIVDKKTLKALLEA